jgi:hypothetical protein
MTYTLYRVDDPTGDPLNGVAIGDYASFEAALDARDDDTARLFSTTGPGLVLTAHHQIVGPGALGEATAHPMTTSLPRSTQAAVAEVEDARRWLRQIHGMA